MRRPVVVTVAVGTMCFAIAPPPIGESEKDAAVTDNAPAILDAPARIHEETHAISRWGGTLADVLVLVHKASDELSKRLDADPPTVSIRVEYGDGHDPFRSVEQFAEAIPLLPIAKIRKITFYTIANNAADDWVTLVFAAAVPGLLIIAHSLDRVWALGLTELLTERAKAGALPEQSGKHHPIKWWEWAVIVLMACTLGVGLTLIALGEVAASDGIPSLLMVEGLLAFPLIGVWDRGIENPALKIVAQGASATAAEPQPSLSVSVREWIRERPLLSVTLAFLFAIASNQVSDLL